MKPQWVDEMIAQRRVKLGFWRSIEHYLPSILVSAIALSPITISVFTSEGTVDLKEALSRDFWLMAIFISLGLVIAAYQYYQLKLREYRIPHTPGQFALALNRTSYESNWVIHEFSNRYAKAERFGKFLDSSDGEVINLIRDNNRILINSISSLTGRGYFAFGRNRKNVRVFLAHLQDVVDLKDYTPQIQEERDVNEWSFKRILIRLIMYPLCLAMIIGSLFFVIPQNILLGLVPLALGSAYIYLDLKLIVTWYKDKSVKNNNLNSS